MYFESSIAVRRPCDEVWAFLGDISNVSKWDRGVSRTEPIGTGVPGVGFEFATFAHPRGGDSGEWGKMCYRITEIDATRRSATTELTSRTGNARYARSAAWRFRVEAAPEGSQVISSVDFKIRLRYLYLVPVFLLIWRYSFRKDLESLKRALENDRN